MPEAFLLFDCQTTASNTKDGRLLEVAWCLFDKSGTEKEPELQSYLLKDHDDPPLPARIARLTGISEDSFETEDCLTRRDFAEIFIKIIQQKKPNYLVIHYAQFEMIFLKPLLDPIDPSWQSKVRLVCTHKLSKMLVPGLPSYSLRAVAGNLGYPLEEKKRAKGHLDATLHIWQKLQTIVEELGLPFDRLLDEMQAKKKKTATIKAKKKNFATLIDKDKRLAIEKAPGIYHLKDQTGRILYVGKAKNLFNRVNSYFRGQQSKGARLNELLAQVRDFETFPASCELEALILENRDIKAINPPYNRQLKAEDRQLRLIDLNALLFSDWKRDPAPLMGYLASSRDQLAFWQDYLSFSQKADGEDLLAESLPFGQSILEGLEINDIWNSFHQLLAPEQKTVSRRDCLQRLLGLWLDERQSQIDKTVEKIRLNIEKKNAASEEDEDLDEDELDLEEVASEPRELSAQDIAWFLYQNLRFVLRRIHRSRWLARLNYSNIVLDLDDERRLYACFRGDQFKMGFDQKIFDTFGCVQDEGLHWRQNIQQFDLERSDRMTIVYAAIRQSLLHSRFVEVSVVGRPKMEARELLRHLY